jgi:gliding motility-associated-like protein
LVVDINYVYQNRTVSGNVLTNDNVSNVASVQLHPTSTPSCGTVTIANNGAYTYTPSSNTPNCTLDSFQYTVCNTQGLCASQWVFISIARDDSPNQVLIALHDSYITLINVPVSGNVLNNDFDPLGRAITVDRTPVVMPRNGTVALNSDGTFTYTPNNNFLGIDTFWYRVCNTANQCLTRRVVIRVIPNDNPSGNNNPYAGDDANTTFINVSVNGDLSNNDFDPNNNPLTYNNTPITAPTNGTVVINNDGTYTYTPNNGFVGSDFFVYIVCDPSGLCDTATAYLIVNNTVPRTRPDMNVVNQGQTVSGNVLINDVIADKKPSVRLNPSFQPRCGTVTIAPNGRYTYTANSQGNCILDSFVYTVCNSSNQCINEWVYINIIQSDNRDPFPNANPDFYTTYVNRPVSGNVLNNDISPNGSTLTVNTTPAGRPSNGAVVLNANGTFTYTPNPGFVGTDRFWYTVCTPTNKCVTRQVTVQVVPDFNRNDPPFANDDMFVTLINTPINRSMAGNDSDPNSDILVYNTTPLVPPLYGTVTIKTDGTFVYTPNNQFVGNDQFRYIVCDQRNACDTATVYIVITNLAPSAINDINAVNSLESTIGNVLTNDVTVDRNVTTTVTTQPNCGNVIMQANGEYTYTSTNTSCTSDSFMYRLCNSTGQCSSAWVFIAIVKNPLQQAPIAKPDYYVTFVNTPRDGNVLGNDTDLAGRTLSVNLVLASNTSHGTVVINPNGTFTYTPNPNYIGTDEFWYTVCNTNQQCVNQRVIIQVIPRDNNPKPFANDDLYTTGVNRIIKGNVKNNDYDLDNSPLTYSNTTVSGPNNGTVVINADGTFTYTPNPDFIGSDRFVYTVCNANNVCTQATVYILISKYNTDDIKPTQAISPNGDGMNDVWSIPNLSVFKHKVHIVNRWGTKVFFTENYNENETNNSFRGDWNGVNLPDGTYFYVIELQETNETKQGFIEVYR